MGRVQYYLGPGRMAVLERWLPNTVTILDRFHCSLLSSHMASSSRHISSYYASTFTLPICTFVSVYPCCAPLPSLCRMKKPCLTYKVWPEYGGQSFGAAVVVKFSPWDREEKEGSWSDVSCVCVYTQILSKLINCVYACMPVL